jgi:undecaprenyl pyrophosphate phosphatase UppP
VAVAVAVGLPTFVHAWTVPSLLPVLALTGVFLLTESVQLHLEVRKQTISASPTELAIVVGLVEVGGFWTAFARVVAVAVVMGLRRSPTAKLTFNVALALIELAAALALLSLLPPLEIDQPLSWLVLVLVMLVVWVVGVTGVGLAVTLTEGFPGWPFWLGALPNALVGPLCVVVAVISLLVTRETPWAWALIAPMVLAVVTIFWQSSR